MHAETPEDSVIPANAGGEEKRSLSVQCWGTRGSIPSPGPATAGYGGNTTCLEVTAGDRRIIFDAGTGIRILGKKLMQEGGPRRASIFLTHFHWDHIQGFPFFAPVYNPDFDLRIVGPVQEGLSVESLFAGQMGPIYFPIPYRALSASLTFDHLQEGSWAEDGFLIRTMRMRHPSHTVGYRVEAFGRALVFIPDNELEGGSYPVSGRWRDDLEEFVAGADLLFHDAMFTDEEYSARRGWGHSTYRQTLDLAGNTGVKELFLFHHAPERSDAALELILDRCRSEILSRGWALRVHAAQEGRLISVQKG